MFSRATFLRGLKRIVGTNASAFRAAKMVQVYSHYALGIVHEREFRIFAKLPSDGLFVDIGANLGQSAFSFAVTQRKWRIRSFEINPSLESWLRRAKRLLGGRFDYDLAGIGPAATHTLVVPTRHGIEFSGEGSLYRDLLGGQRVKADVGGDFELAEYPVRTIPFDGLNLSPDVVKIDVQGHEFAVLESMTATIDRCHPIFLIESGRGQDDYTRFLQARGYDRLKLAGDSLRLIPADTGPVPQNFVFLSKSAPDAIRRALLGEWH